MSEKVAIRPYARLITMLGDQLIKNELIALIELIKNAYDADASWVKVEFINFGENFSVTDTSKIVIEDDGCGMDAEILKRHWLNPATPTKLKQKRVNARTSKGRFLQGEKGIGRFAIFKLGKKIKIITRRQKNNDMGADAGEMTENTLIYDFSQYDDDFLTEDGVEKELFLDHLEIELSESRPTYITDREVILGITKRKRKPHGTIIEIENIKTRWDVNRVARIQAEVGKLQPIFSNDENSDFSVWIYRNGQEYKSTSDYKEKLRSCLDHKAVFKVTNGQYIADGNKISFELNGQMQSLDFEDPDINGLNLYKKSIGVMGDSPMECGNFRFEFYLFDFNADMHNSPRFFLEQKEKGVIRDHRIYLYRDGIRVMPYGDPEDDWLNIDVARGTVRADEFLSNDQIVGCVYITQSENPKLVDKTNREGLIEDGRALHDFIFVLQIILQYLRKKPFAQHSIEKKKKKELDDIKKGRPSEVIERLKKEIGTTPKVDNLLADFEKSYKKERQVFEERIYKTENLAAVGLSIETAAHDVMLFIKKTLEQMDALIRQIMMGEVIDQEALLERLTSIRGNLSIIDGQMKDVRLLFPSTKSKTKNINVKEILDKVYNLYKRVFKEYNIELSFDITGSPLVAKTTEAVLLQVFINLFDNSLYWLKDTKRERKILITMNGNEQRLIFSDNGPGIKVDDVNYIFEAFYSGKGEEGRGLGLYIARQLLDRYDYSIELAEFSRDKLLAGANFVIEFVRER